MRTRAAAAFQSEVEKQDLTHAVVEQRIGLAVRSGQITRLFNGERKPGRELSFRIFKEFGVEMLWWELPEEQPKTGGRGRAA